MIQVGQGTPEPLSPSPAILLLDLPIAFGATRAFLAGRRSSVCRLSCCCWWRWRRRAGRLCWAGRTLRAARVVSKKERRRQTAESPTKSSVMCGSSPSAQVRLGFFFFSFWKPLHFECRCTAFCSLGRVLFRSRIVASVNLVSPIGSWLSWCMNYREGKESYLLFFGQFLIFRRLPLIADCWVSYPVKFVLVTILWPSKDGGGRTRKWVHTSHQGWVVGAEI